MIFGGAGAAHRPASSPLAGFVGSHVNAGRAGSAGHLSFGGPRALDRCGWVSAGRSLIQLRAVPECGGISRAEGKNGAARMAFSADGLGSVKSESSARNPAHVNPLRMPSWESITSFNPSQRISTSVLVAALVLTLGLGIGQNLEGSGKSGTSLPISSVRSVDIERFADSVDAPRSAAGAAAGASGPSEVEARRNMELKTNFAAGMLTGALSKGMKQIFLFPLDTLRVRAQRRSSPSPLESIDSDAHADERQAKQGEGRGSLPSAQALISTVREAYAGWIPALLCGGPAAAAFFSTNGYVKSILLENGVDGTATLLIAAAVASTAGWTVRVPFEVVKTSVQGRVHKNSWSALKGLLQEGGPSRLWRPLPRFLIQYLPGDPIKMAVYDYSQAAIAAWQGAAIQGWQQSGCGSLAYAVVTVLSNPASVGNTRMILEPGKYSSLAECVRSIAAEEGIEGLSRGLAPRLGKAVVSGAVTFGIYEMSKAFVAAHL